MVHALNNSNKMKREIAWGVMILAVLLFGPPALCQETGGSGAPPSPERRPFGSLEKSLLIPGWGQFSENRIIEGILFLGAEIFCLSEVFVNGHRGNENYALYRAAADRDGAVRYRGLTEKYDRRRNQFLLAGAAVWAFNLLDITLIVKAKDRARSALTFRIGQNESHALEIVAGYRF
jgi:hypothetical protein